MKWPLSVLFIKGPSPISNISDEKTEELANQYIKAILESMKQKSGKISDESPIGMALMGKSEGESIEIKTPAETQSFKIDDIW